MTVLIELFDATEPFNNVLTLTALKPDLLLVLGDTQVQKKRTQAGIRQYIHASGLRLDVQFRACRTYDFEQITEALNDVIDEFGTENCVVDVLGGSEALLLAVGYCCRERAALRVITHRAKTNDLIWLHGPDKNQVLSAAFEPDLEALIALSGGQLLRHGHVGTDELSDDILAMIPDVFAVYMNYRSQWASFVQYLQQLNEPRYKTGKASFCGPCRFQVNRRTVTVNVEIIMALMDAKVVTDFQRSADTCTVRFCSEQILRYLCDVGAWLELYTYAILHRSGLFRSVEISTVVSWDNDDDNRDTINEIDVVALDGVGQLFISCKTATPDNAVLQEIATLTERFGTQYAIPVLVTASPLEQQAPGVYYRALEMGVAVIDANDLKADDFLARLRSLRKRWNIR